LQLDKRKIFIAAGAIVIAGGIVTGLFQARHGNVHGSGSEETVDIAAQEPEYRFGISVDSFKIEEITVKKNENLSHILLARGISYGEIDRIARESKPVFNVRNIKAGNKCTFFWTRDSIPAVSHFVYEKNIEEYVSYTLGDSLSVDTGRKEVIYEQREIAGSIETSLWNSLAGLNVSPRLSLDMSDIYAWTIDFFGLQKGDSYRLIYEVKIIDGETVGINRIMASSFVHAGKEHFAFAFEQNGRIEYFDENGQSLRRAFLKAPLNFRRISSKYSNSRLHPILKIYRPHLGIDYAADAGTPVVSIGDGRVVKVAYDKASGNYIKIKHNSVYTSGYLHLQRRPKFNVGDYVKQGNQIGEVGATGYATGPHLDFRIWKNGQLIDPQKIESPPVEPVAAEHKIRYDSLVTVFRRQLDGTGQGFKYFSDIPE